MTPTTIPSRATTDETTVCRFFDAWAAGDVSGVDDLVDGEVVLGPIVGLLYAREIYVGRGGVAAAFGELANRWDRFDITVEDSRAADGEVLAVLRLLVEKRGMSSEMHVPVVCRVRDGRIALVVDAE